MGVLVPWGLLIVVPIAVGGGDRCVSDVVVGFNVHMWEGAT